MPSTGGGEGHPGNAEKVEIGGAEKKALKEAGYNGPWEVTPGQERALLRKYLKDQNTGKPTPDPTLPPGTGPGGGGGSAGMSAKQKANLRASYAKMLDDFGLSLNKNMNALMDTGVHEEWSTTNFLLHLRNTKEYKVQFPHIYSRNGRVDELSYLHQREAYEDIAKAAGVRPPSREQFGTLFAKDIEQGEWQLRMDFASRVTGNKPYWDQVERVAKARGFIKPNEHLTKKDLYNLMTGKGSPAIEKLMEESVSRYQLETAGFEVGPQGDITRRQLLGFIKRTEAAGIPGFQIEEGDFNQNFQQLAQVVSETMSASEQVGAGLSKGDIFQLQFGGPKQKEVAEYVKRILASRDRANQGQQGGEVLTQQGDHSALVSGAPKRPEGL
jgi:hypothetical protein